MKVLVLGSGAREHALGWCLSQNSAQVYCVPGNGGTLSLAKNVAFSEQNSAEMVAWAQQQKIDLTLVGPEALLCLGIVDQFQQAGLKIVGTSKKVSQLEGNKVFTKELLQRYGLPTAEARVFEQVGQARQFIMSQTTFPQVIKASGLASGKGAFIVMNQKEALDVITQIMEEKIFGNAGDTILMEEFLMGEEISLQALVCGESFQILPLIRDYKRLGERNQGVNTGGMGACGPLTHIDLKSLEKEIVQPLLKALAREDFFYQGILYLGLILTAQGPKILEINCRFGDPEFSVLALIQKGNWVEIFAALAEGILLPHSWKTEGFAVSVVKATSGYPWAKHPISFLPYKEDNSIKIFQSNTLWNGGQFHAEGGRVLEITAWGKTEKEAHDRVYAEIKQKHFHSEIYRQDIAQDWSE